MKPSDAMAIAILSVAVAAGAAAAGEAKREKGLDLVIDYGAALDREPEARDRPRMWPRLDVLDRLRQSAKWRRMEIVEEQGGERADLSRRAAGKLKVAPVLGNRRQAGNPVRYNDDLNEKAVGIDFTLDF